MWDMIEDLPTVDPRKAPVELYEDLSSLTVGQSSVVAQQISMIPTTSWNSQKLVNLATFHKIEKSFLTTLSGL